MQSCFKNFAHEYSMQIKYLFWYFLIENLLFNSFFKFTNLIFCLHISIKVIDSWFFLLKPNFMIMKNFYLKIKNKCFYEKKDIYE
jgi:hypothetical protein